MILFIVPSCECHQDLLYYTIRTPLSLPPQIFLDLTDLFLNFTGYLFTDTSAWVCDINVGK
jgi:hypothetical protein